jgi:hypothetical protein
LISNLETTNSSEHRSQFTGIAWISLCCQVLKTARVEFRQPQSAQQALIQQYAHEINVVEARGNGRPPGRLPVKAQAARNAKSSPTHQ